MTARSEQKSSTRTRASSLDILGGISKAPKVNPKWREQYDHLVTLRDELMRRKEDLTEQAKEETPAFSLHMADAGTDQYDQDFSLSMISSDQNALYEIEEALSRIRSGTYGICELTGSTIESERLQAIPWTRFSMEAQRQLEENGSVTRTKLSPRATLGEAESAEEEEEDDSE